MPSSALTGRPSAPVIEDGSAKNARYSSEGASTASRGAGKARMVPYASAMLTINGVDDLRDKVGQELGVSDWHEVTQDEINRFAEATGDDQWIHLDPERAKETPFGSTIAHGLYTLSLGPKFSYSMFSIDGIAFGVNYGYGKVRFPVRCPSIPACACGPR